MGLISCLDLIGYFLILFIFVYFCTEIIFVLIKLEIIFRNYIIFVETLSLRDLAYYMRGMLLANCIVHMAKYVIWYLVQRSQPVSFLVERCRQRCLKFDRPFSDNFIQIILLQWQVFMRFIVTVYKNIQAIECVCFIKYCCVYKEEIFMWLLQIV